MPMSIMVWNKIYRKELFDNLRFPEGYIHEDVLMTPLLLDKAIKIGCIDHLMYNYNIHLGSSSTTGMTVNFNKVVSFIEMYRRVYSYFKNSSFQEISRHTTALYFNTLLHSYYVCHQQRKTDIDWQIKKTEIIKEINENKDTIMNICPSKAFHIFFASHWLFLLLKASTIKAKRLKYKMYCILTGKN